MATVTPHNVISNRAEADRRVRHPLDSLRGYIRMYVSLEGAAVAVLYLAIWFWLGLGLDYGLFQMFALDWVEELNATFPSTTALVTRALGLGLLVLGLLTVVGLKVVTRLFREFSDAGLALVLERRFPKQLGDRLITAVELADPRLAKKYGYSQAMVDHTIRDAAERVERVPVREVFNWLRLYWQWGLVGLLTIGIYALTGLSYAIVAAASEDGTPLHFFGRFNAVASMWAERNLLLMNTYWPRQCYLEVLRFQDSAEHPGEMRVGRDEQRPDLQVRAVQWVVADDGPTGWKPLRWEDLKDVVGDQLASVALPANWPGWLVDLDDLDPSVPASVIPTDWNGKTVGQVRAQIAADPELEKGLISAGAKEPLEKLLDWQQWTVDKIQLQLARPSDQVSHPMRAEHFEARKQFEDLFAALDEMAASPRMARRLRKLAVPDEVQVYYRGKTTKSSSPHERRADNKYSIGLGELKESVRFTVRGGDYYTPSKLITLVPPPSLTAMTMFKDEPAYIYYRLQGDQNPLKGEKQKFRDVPVSISGETSTILVPLGTDVKLVAKVDRPLKDGIRILPPTVRKVKGSTLPEVKIERGGDGEDKDKVFWASFLNINKAIEFEFLFNDLDNVKGRRHVVIEPVDDRGPQEVVNVELTVVLRKPQIRNPGKGQQAVSSDAYLITPDALLPWKGIFRDDYGLTRMDWVYFKEEVEFELFGAGRPSSGDKKEPSGLLAGDPQLYRPGLVVSGLQEMPGLFATAYAAWLDRMMSVDLTQPLRKASVTKGAVPMELFKARLEERAGDELPAGALKERLVQPPPKQQQYREHPIQQEEGFDFRKFMPEIKSRDVKEPQKHYRIRVFVSATDNNIETGPTSVLNKLPVSFLVVSENELLAQILVEEENLRERLEKAIDKLKNGRTFLEEQVTKLSAPVQPKDLSIVGLRADEVRKLLMDASGLTREIATDYNRILREMEVNRIDARRVGTVDEKICKPLERIINPTPDPVRGNFAAAETAATRLWEPVEEDVARFKKAQDLKGENDPALLATLESNRAGHRASAQEAREQMDRLLEQMKGVLEAMQGELLEREIIALLVQIESDQRQRANELRLWHDEEIKKILNDLLNPKKK